MLRTILRSAKSDDHQPRGMAELQHLLSAVPGADPEKGLDVQALADIEDAVLNNGGADVISLYRHILAEVDIKPDEAKKRPFISRLAWPSRVRDRLAASVASCLAFADSIAARRNERDCGGCRSSQTDYLR